MEPSVFQTAECGMKTKKFLQGERRKTILGELHNKVSEREIERTFKLNTDIDSYSIARFIYDELKELPRKEPFFLLRIGIIRSIIIQTQYELNTHDKSLKRKITVNLYEREQAAVKIKSPPIKKHKKVKVKAERKFFLPSVNGENPEKDIQEILDENVSEPLKESKSWKKEKYQIFIVFNENIFTISISQVHMLEDKDNLIADQSKVTLRRIEVEYQGAQWPDLSENVQAKERKQTEIQDIVEAEQKEEKEIIRQTRKISQRILEICENGLCLSLITV